MQVNKNYKSGNLFGKNKEINKLKIVILTLNHFYSNKVIKDLIFEYKDNISLIVDSKVLLYRKSFLEAILKYLRISGLEYILMRSSRLLLYEFYSSIQTSIFPRNIKSNFYSFRALATKYYIPVLGVKDMNGESLLNILTVMKPDIIISIFCNQIFGKDLIKTAKKAVINLHPAYLPDYKGVSPVFWAMVNGEKYIGATVHFIDQGIDTGKIIERRKINVSKSDTEDTLYWKAANVGAKMLINSISKIERGNCKTIPNIGGRYFSLPTKDSVTKLSKNSKKIYRFKDILTR